MPHSQSIDRCLGAGCVAVGIAQFVLAAGFVLQAPWATALWPLPDSRLTMIFVGAIVAAVGAAVVWIGIARDWAACAAGALNVTITAGGLAITLFILSRYRPTPLAPFAIAALAVALANLALFAVTRRLNWRDTRPTPRPVTISFAVFALILLAVGGALLAGIPNVMPWLISRDTAVLIGWIFLGDAFYFVYAIARPRWSNAAPQLWSFLAYDLMLLPPLALHTEVVAPQLRTNLTIYLAVLIFSAALAVHYLLLYPATRLRGRAAPPPSPLPPRERGRGRGG